MSISSLIEITVGLIVKSDKTAAATKAVFDALVHGAASPVVARFHAANRIDGFFDTAAMNPMRPASEADHKIENSCDHQKGA